MDTPAPPLERQLARLTVPAAPPSLSVALAVVRDLATRQGLRPRVVERLAFVAEEACVNIIDRAFPAEESGTFDLLVLRRPGQLVVVLEDQGLPFDFRDFEAEERSSLAELLARRFVGTVLCSSQGRRGNRVELTCDLPAAAPLAHVAAAEIARASAAADADEPTIRLMQPEDAEALTRCLYRTYGYTYVYDFMYDPEQVRQRQQAGVMHSVVAVTAAGEVIGHIALTLERPDDKVGESGQAVVDPRYRGRHFFEHMKAALVERARVLGNYGMYSEAVTVHPFSQKGILAVGGQETGVELAVFPPSMSFKKLAGTQQKQRQSLMLIYLPIGTAPRREVYLPPAHAALVARIYERLGLARAVAPLPAVALPSLSRVDVQAHADTGIARLEVRAAGQDLPALVRFRVRELCRQRIDWIGIDLPLGDAAAMALVPAIEEIGFCFCGILPELADGDVLRLQFLNNVAFDPVEVAVASDFGREMLNYVVQAQAAVERRGQ